MESDTAKAKKFKKNIEAYPENAQFEEDVRSFGDETPSDDTGEQQDISKQDKSPTDNSKQASSKRKRKRDDPGSKASSKDKVSNVSEQEDSQPEAEAIPYAREDKKENFRILEIFSGI